MWAHNVTSAYKHDFFWLKKEESQKQDGNSQNTKNEASQSSGWHHRSVYFLYIDQNYNYSKIYHFHYSFSIWLFFLLCLYLFHFMLFQLLHLQCYSFPRGNQFFFNSCHLFHFSKRFLSGAEERAAVVEWASTLWNFNNCPICTWLSGGSNPQHNQAETDGTGTAGNSPGIVCTGMWRKLKCENYSE